MAKGFKHGAGGNSLNFKVVGGTTEPSNPKENTILVNTDKEITGWHFSSKQPEDTKEGTVWISTGTSGPIEFNALKKNGIQVYPISAKQYVSGAWVDVTVKSYQGGVWVEWIPSGALYWKGEECTDITGGWTDTLVWSGKQKDTPTKNADNFYFTSTSNSFSGFSTGNRIDLSKYSKMSVTFELKNITGGSGLNMQISPTRSLNSSEYVLEKSFSGELNKKVTESFPININGAYHVNIFCAAGRKANVYSVWVE